MYKSEVFKTWALVLQLGISMLVPILLLIAFAHILDSLFGVNLMLIAVILGLFSGIRNTYVILKNYLNSIKNEQGKESELMKRHLNSIKKD